MLTRFLCLTLAVTSASFAHAGDKGDKKAAAVDSSCLLFKRKQMTDVDLRGSDDKTRGEIDGLLIDTGDGTIRYALVGTGGVLGIGETEHLIPWEAIRTGADKDGDKCVAHTDLTQEQIDAAPTYRNEIIVDTKLERAARKNARLSDEPRAGFAKQLLLAADIEGALVRSGDGKDLGKIDDVILSASGNRVAFFVLDTDSSIGLNGRQFALPWGVTTITVNKENKTELRTDLTKERLQDAPEYDKKDWKRMSTGTWADDLCKHYSVPSFCSASRL